MKKKYPDCTNLKAGEADRPTASLTGAMPALHVWEDLPVDNSLRAREWFWGRKYNSERTVQFLNWLLHSRYYSQIEKNNASGTEGATYYSIVLWLSTQVMLMADNKLIGCSGEITKY